MRKRSVKVFDFSASYTGGGLKRLVAFLEVFGEDRTSIFLVHPSLRGRIGGGRLCEVFYIDEAKFWRLFPFSVKKFLVLRQFAEIELFFSYGIPNLIRYGRRNVLHVSNILPFTHRRFGMAFLRWVEIQYLGFLCRIAFWFVDVVAVESAASVRFLPRGLRRRTCVSPNGVDDELGFVERFLSIDERSTDSYAICVGVQPYKRVKNCIELYRRLKIELGLKRLVVVGGVGANLEVGFEEADVEYTGEIAREEVLRRIKNSSVYISSTAIENSYNAACEGAILAPLSFISNIPVHLEFAEKFFRNFEFSEGGEFIRLQSRHADLHRLPTWRNAIESYPLF